MRNWFPFTDYDFFGYLVSGFTLVFAADYVFNGGVIMFRENWTFVEIILAVGVAYFTGQITAYPSSLIIEHLLSRRVLTPPIRVMLSDGWPNLFSRVIGRAIVGRYYEPLPDPMRRKLIQRAAADNGTTTEKVEGDSELVFGPAFRIARQNADTRERLDGFRNQYALNRNMAFTALVTAGLFAWGPISDAPNITTWVVLALLLFAGLLARFLKFYAAFAAEVLRAYAYSEPGKDSDNADDS